MLYSSDSRQDKLIIMNMNFPSSSADSSILPGMPRNARPVVPEESVLTEELSRAENSANHTTPASHKP